MMRFFDTNVVVYAFLGTEKRAMALEVLGDGGVISAQVLNEFSNVALRKFGRSWDETALAVATLRMRFPKIAVLDTDTHAAAMALVRTHNFNFYDALIVAAALLASCEELLSEDMQHGMRIGPMTTRNPFAPD